MLYSIKKKTIIIIMLLFVLFIFISSLHFLGILSFDYNGIAVDNDKNIYIGTDYTIDVYNNMQLERKIVAKNTPGGAYDFTIENNKILICKNIKIYTMNLQGDLLEIVDDDSMSKSNEISNKSYPIHDIDGNKYYLIKFFGYYKVIKVDTNNSKSVVFKMPIINYICKILQMLAFVCLFPLIFIVVLKYTKGN